MKKIFLCMAILAELGFAFSEYEYETRYKNNDFVGAYYKAHFKCLKFYLNRDSRAYWFESKMLYEGKGIRQDVKS